MNAIETTPADRRARRALVCTAASIGSAQTQRDTAPAFSPHRSVVLGVYVVVVAGDGALQAADGYDRILGRIDDVINVAGHRLGTKEIESSSLLVEEVAEAAVIPARDEIKGKVPDLYVSLKPGYQPGEDIRKRVEDAVIRETLPVLAVS
jgi:acyl-coenzyme A synthetase/AMP-(fatty) acid ligase